jgi:uncharacterized protein (DUF1501 family)
MDRFRTSRRRFLAGSLAGAGLCALETSVDLGLVAEAGAADAGDYRALVCVLFAGGIDSFNVLVPTDDAGWNEYAAVRADLALPRNALLPLAGTHQGGRSFGIHPSLPELGGLFDAGELAFLANVGPLVAPATPADLAAGRVREPLGLYSHADQIDQWQTALADVRSTTGVAGRMADLLGDVNPGSPVAMNVSVSGANRFQAGRRTSEYSIDPGADGAPVAAGYGPDLPGGAIVTPAIDGMLAVDRRSLLRAFYGTRLRQALDAGVAFNAALAASPTPTTVFPDDPFGQALGLVAKVIASREALGARRQTFFVNYGGWDHHDEVLGNMERMLPAVDAGLARFRDAMVELGLHDRVTTFTISDFGRTLTSNGRGSDHGWGGNMLALGGAVDGGRIAGDFPALAAGAPLDTGRGRFVPTTSTDAFYAELALWFGIPASELDLVVPNVGEFWSPVPGGRPVGLLR